jgi:hypothetical protein
MMANARGQGLPFRDVIKVDEHAALAEAQQQKQQQQSEAASAATAASCKPKKRPVPLSETDPIGDVKAPKNLCAPSTSEVAGACTNPPAAVTSTRKVWFSHGIVGEPIFIPRVPSSETSPADEDDGWLFVQCYIPEKHCTDFVILCARDPHKGPLAVIHLKHHVCYGFHGTFAPHVFMDDALDGPSVHAAAPPEMRAKL